MAYKISGTVLVIGQTQSSLSKSGNTYTMRELVITIRKFDPYTGHPSDDEGNTPKFTFMGDKCQQLDNVKIGDIVVVHFDISGRKYQKDGNTNFITDVRPFRVDLLNNSLNQSQQNTPTQASPMASKPDCVQTQQSLPYEALQQPQAATNASRKGDDLPF